jgi:hypothetical protein
MSKSKEDVGLSKVADIPNNASDLHLNRFSIELNIPQLVSEETSNDNFPCDGDKEVSDFEVVGIELLDLFLENCVY